MDSDVVSEAGEAWARLRDRARATFDDWVRIARAFDTGRSARQRHVRLCARHIDAEQPKRATCRVHLGEYSA